MKLRYLIWFLGTLIFLVLSCNNWGREELPIYNPSDFNAELVDVSLQSSNGNHTVSDFELINQNGKIVTQEDYRDRVYIVDFFFTRCPSICPLMTSNMIKIQNEFINNSDIMLLSLSVTPEIDSISVLRKYANDKGAIDSKWNITTGNKKHIYELARKSYFAVVEQGDGGMQDFIHTPNFILVDKKRQIRGVYNGTEDEEINRLMDDLRILIKSNEKLL
ncbi:SCO family protein [Maribacter arcticus]|uniref:Protein SCO1/2 n=1 Tax=Maribacter arcticus TaxID=561365 RepID=A0A1T5BJL2_9FLAO|nr:SCO family protein [Maribacter arcticus]SKB47484.1 protein SCO1/2 [Maribacter arcticus]|tara:strand:+ start:133 stop:789 length:657 start_codon:yes stop_codon:yes gene_type:complete